MLGRSLALAVGALAVSACRTEIRPTVAARPPPASSAADRADGGCAVEVHTAAADVAPGSENLGWIRVDHQGTDEATLEALKAEVCRRGGRAVSQVRWTRKPGTGLESPPLAVEANAWRDGTRP